MGRPGDTTMMPLPQPPSSGTAGPASSSTDDSASSASAETTSSATDSTDTGSTSTGPSCGANGCTDLDILLVVDNSDSMSQWLAPLGNSLPDLFDLFEQELSEVCSFHIGIANAEQMPQTNSADCQFSGALVQRLEACGGQEGDVPYYSEAEGSAADAFAALQCTFIQQGFGGDEDERMLGAMLGALDPVNSAQGACNEGFRRPDAELVLIYISDENDPTPMDEQDTVAELFGGFVDPGLVAFISVVGDPDNEAPQCQWVPDGDEGTGAELSSALNGFLALSGIPLSQQARIDICERASYDFSRAFEVFSTVCDSD